MHNIFRLNDVARNIESVFNRAYVSLKYTKTHFSTYFYFDEKKQANFCTPRVRNSKVI